MTDRKAFLCPHGVDVSVRLKTEPENATRDFVTETIKYTYEQNECLQCAADMGYIELFQLYGTAGA